MMQFEYSLKGTYVPTAHREEMNQVFFGTETKRSKTPCRSVTCEKFEKKGEEQSKNSYKRN